MIFSYFKPTTMIQEIFEKHLRENETLLAVTAGHLLTKGHNTSRAYLGLTEEYLIFYIEPRKKNRKETVLRIHRSFIRSMSWYFRNISIKINFLKDTIYIKSNIYSVTQIHKFVKEYKNTIRKYTIFPENEKTELFYQIHSLYKLSCLRTAKSEFKKASQQNIFLKFDPAVRSLNQIIKYNLFSLRLSGSFIFIISLLLLLSAICSKDFLGIFLLIISIPAAIMLFLEDQSWRRLGNLTAILALIYYSKIKYSILGLFTGNSITTGIWVGLTLPVLVLLNTKFSRPKLFISAAVFFCAVVSFFIFILF